jgi:hypothetical protein
VAAYRAAKMREKHAAEGSPHPPNPYDTTGWAKPMHPVYMCVFVYIHTCVCIYRHLYYIYQSIYPSIYLSIYL